MSLIRWWNWHSGWQLEFFPIHEWFHSVPYRFCPFTISYSSDSVIPLLDQWEWREPYRASLGQSDYNIVQSTVQRGGENSKPSITWWWDSCLTIHFRHIICFFSSRKPYSQIMPNINTSVSPRLQSCSSTWWVFVVIGKLWTWHSTWTDTTMSTRPGLVETTYIFQM